MKKILIIGSLLLSSLLFVSCSATNGVDIDAKSANFTHFEKKPLTTVHKLIVEAGKEDGWRMTEFKDNELLAEKTEDGDTKAVSIEFSQDYFHLTPSDSDLKDAIEDKLEE
jgi:predicted small secreted protein